MHAITAIITFMLFSPAFYHIQTNSHNDVVVGNGRLPNVVIDKENNVHIVYGTGDSIMYVYSRNQGVFFSQPTLVALLPKLFANAMRGPQIAATSNGIVITANTEYGNIYSYYKEDSGKWSAASKVTDMDSVSREALMALSADGSNAYAVWLDVRNNGGKGQRLFGAQSKDGGKTWSKNRVIYASPEQTICECCKPSVLVKDNNVYAMFRNWLNGNRDLYLISSTDGGNTFGPAKKLGTGNWKLDGCPMDGGGLALAENGTIQTVWRREGKIYASSGENEKKLGEGRSCSVAIVNDKNVYTWTQNGEVVILKPQGEITILGKGSVPIIRTINNDKVICVWENERQIHVSVIEI